MNKTEIKTDWEKELIEIEDYEDHEKAFLLWMIENDDIDPAEYENSASDMLEWINEYSHEYNWSGMSDGAPGEYSVFTDNEADTAWNESLDSYIDDCILPEIPEAYQTYFDEKSWKKDAKMDGRGHTLNRYDGCEHEVKFNGEYYYIYRTN